MNVRDAMIVAGGRGTRLAPLTDTCPKPLLPLVGTPFLVGQVQRLAAAGIDRVFLVVGDDTGPFESLAAPLADLGVTMVLVPEPRPLDTAGGVRSAIGEVSGPVVVCNGDVLTDVDVPALVAAHTAHGADATISLIRVEDTSTYGVCVREGTRIVDFVEKPAPGSLPGQDTVNAGTYVVEPEAMLAFPEGPLSFERTVFPGILAGGGHVEGVVWDGVWADLGTPSRYLAGHRFVLDGAMDWPRPDGLVARGGGVHVHRDASVATTARVHGPAVVLAEARVDDDVDLGPHVVIGPDVRVGAGAGLRDCVLLRGARVGAGVTVEASILGRGAVVGDGGGPLVDVVMGDRARLAPGASVEAGARLRA